MYDFQRVSGWCDGTAEYSEWTTEGKGEMKRVAIDVNLRNR